MVQSLELPILSLAVPTKLNDINADNISSMWSVFSKCKDNLENGRRLENLSWRIWYRESTHRKSSTAPIAICQKSEEEYFQPSAGSSMNDSAVSGCGRSAKPISSFTLESPVEEANRRESARKPTTTESTRLSSHDSSSSQPRSNKFYIKEKNLIHNDHHDDDDDTSSEWSAQDDETVFAHDDDDDEQEDWDFRKQVPKSDDLPKRSLLSIMLQKQQEQQRISRPHLRPIQQQKKPIARRIHRPGDLSESLQFCVDWERRQNVSPPAALLHQQRRSPACVATSRATATCTTSSWFEPFRGW